MSDETHVFTIDQLGRGNYDVFVEDAAPNVIDEIASYAATCLSDHEDIAGLEVTVKVFR